MTVVVEYCQTIVLVYNAVLYRAQSQHSSTVRGTEDIRTPIFTYGAFEAYRNVLVLRLNSPRSR